MVRMKGGTMLLTRTAAADIVDSLRDTSTATESEAAAPAFVAAAEEPAAPVPKPGGRTRARARARNADFDPSILPTAPAVYEAIARQEAEQKAGTAAAPKSDAAPTRTAASQRNTMVVSDVSSATPDGSFKCDVCGKAYPIANDLRVRCARDVGAAA